MYSPFKIINQTVPLYSPYKAINETVLFNNPYKVINESVPLYSPYKVIDHSTFRLFIKQYTSTVSISYPCTVHIRFLIILYIENPNQHLQDAKWSFLLILIQCGTTFMQ